MYCPCTFTVEWVALKCESIQLISAWVLEVQYVIVIGFDGVPADGDPDDDEELHAAAVRASRIVPAIAACLCIRPSRCMIKNALGKTVHER
jgi:hypothetical protein